MHDDARATFKNAIVESLGVLKDAGPAEGELHLVWTKEVPDRWSGQWKELPSFRTIDHSVDWAAVSESIAEAFGAHHTEHLETITVGLLGPRTSRPAEWLRGTVAELWRINNSPDVPDAQVESALDDIAHFVDEDTTDLMLQAPAANVRLPEDVNQVTLGDVVIRRLTNAEVTDLYGGLFSCFH